MTIDLETLSALEELDLQSQILWTVWHGPRRGMTTADIADLLLRPDSSVRDRLQQMRTDGLTISTDDAIPQHQLTDEGRHLARQLRRKMRAA